MGQFTLILGGARSGKSTFAEQQAAAHGGKVVYIATAQALDAEMETRIQHHKQSRPFEWQTLEIPRGIGAALTDLQVAADVFLLDCVTLLVTNLLMEATKANFEPDERLATQKVDEEIEALLTWIANTPGDWFIVSNEVGLGLVPEYPLGRVYRDLLGRANRRLAKEAGEVYFLVAGIPIPIQTFRVPFVQQVDLAHLRQPLHSPLV